MLDTPSANKGFTLLGLLVATGMVLVVMVGVVGLTVRVMSASTDAKNNFIATALAREGIELVRSLRDDNYLNYNPSLPNSKARAIIYWRGLDDQPPPPVPSEFEGVWWQDLLRTALCNGEWVIDPVNYKPPLGQSSTTLEEFTDSSETKLHFDAANSRYANDSSINNPSPFSRVIKISTPDGGNCGEFSNANDATSKPSPITVTSTVTWETEDGATREVSLTQHMHGILRWR